MSCLLCGDECTCSNTVATAHLPQWESRPLRARSAPMAPVTTHSDCSDLTEQQFAASLAAPPENRALDAIECDTLFKAAEPGFYRPEEPAVWREEVSSRVHSYRARRRKRHPSGGSLSLDFEAPATNPRADALLRAREEAREAARIEFAPDPEPTPRPENNLIVFPRPALEETPLFDELAEPVLDRPRILDAPETVDETLATPSLPGITLDEPPPAAPAPPRFELPLKVAPIGQRLFAALADGLIIAVATALFAMVAAKMLPVMPETRALLVLSAAVPALFWAAYQYLFLAYAAVTPGMQFAGVRISRFDGNLPRRDLRGWRAAAMVLSLLSLGMGLAWAYFDEDTLCWHDRITRTYLTGI